MKARIFITARPSAESSRRASREPTDDPTPQSFNLEADVRAYQPDREYFKQPAPASTMVEVWRMTSPEYLIEMSAIAVIV